MKLISMTDFVLEQGKKPNNSDFRERFFVKVLNYANFLKQPLTLGMFVPCDNDGNVLEIPTKENSNDTIDHDTKLMDYNDAKSKVLFNGFNSALNSENCQISVINNSFRASIIYERYYPSQQEKVKTIEDLIPYNLDLVISF